MPKKLEDCVKKLKEQGKSEASAFAICNATLYKKTKKKKGKK